MGNSICQFCTNIAEGNDRHPPVFRVNQLLMMPVTISILFIELVPICTVFHGLLRMNSWIIGTKIPSILKNFFYDLSGTFVAWAVSGLLDVSCRTFFYGFCGHSLTQDLNINQAFNFKGECYVS